MYFGIVCGGSVQVSNLRVRFDFGCCDYRLLGVFARCFRGFCFKFDGELRRCVLDVCFLG